MSTRKTARRGPSRGFSRARAARLGEAAVHVAVKPAASAAVGPGAASSGLRRPGTGPAGGIGSQPEALEGEDAEDRLGPRRPEDGDRGLHALSELQLHLPHAAAPAYRCLITNSVVTALATICARELKSCT